MREKRRSRRLKRTVVALLISGSLGITWGSAPAAAHPTPVACRGGGSIAVSPTIAGEVRHLLAHARADGLALCGSGYRSRAAQIAVRRANCGTSHYATWHAPAQSCSPPTAIPGRSMHQRGLAIDFHRCGAGSACYRWLRTHAAEFGLANLPSEPWHWSTNGQ